MEFKIRKDEFLRGLYLAQGIADRKSTLPSWPTSSFAPREGQAAVRCDGPERDDDGVAVAKVEKEGGLTSRRASCYEIVKGLPTMRFAYGVPSRTGPRSSAGKVEFKVVGMSDRDYPKLPAIQEAQTFNVDSAVLRDMIAKTIFSVSLDETRQHLAGVLFESDGTTARMVSTDGHRLSKVSRPMAGGPKLATGVLIPRKGIVELRRAIETREDAVGDRDPRRELRAQGGRRRHLGQADRRAVPPYDQVIPKDNDRAFEVSRLGFLDALKRVALMSSDKTFGVKLGVEKGKIRVETDNPDLGAAKEEIDVGYKGTPVQIGFNARYFIDLLTEIETPEVRVELSGELDPAVVRPAGGGGDYVCVVMPMRL
jgi:DNA polymerase-3 subunit beta